MIKRNTYFILFGRFARAGPRSEPLAYEMVRFDGSFRRADMAPRGTKESAFPSGLPGNRRNRGREDHIPLHSISSNDIVRVQASSYLAYLKVSSLGSCRKSACYQATNHL